MRIIEKIEIAYFRSFSDRTTIDGCKDLNIFSGKNDSGKSNILRALNLFFTETKTDFYKFLDFEKDFSKYRHKVVTKESIKGKKIFRIKILFNNLDSMSTVLPGQFWVEKIWDKDGKVSRKTKDKKGSIIYDDGSEERKQQKVGTATTVFLNKIDFLYIPAVKDKDFFDFLKKEYQESLGAKISKLTKASPQSKKTLKEWINLLTVGDITEKLTDKINQESLSLMDRFKQFAQEIKESSFAIPDFKIDFSQVLEIATENDIYLPFRGDGVQAKFIPQALDEITKNRNSHLVIWGFEEPENSLEYKNAQLLAEAFKSDHSQKKQLFITSHAFNFISLTGDTVSRYRVFAESFEKGTEVCLIPEDRQGSLSFGEKNEIDKLQDELGVLDLNDELLKIYKEKESERELMIKSRNEYNEILKSRPQKIFICEDDDSKIIELWDFLLKKRGLFDVEVISSKGSSTKFVENGIRYQKRFSQEYNPKIFRQIDRDGLTDGQIELIQSKLFNLEKKELDYEYSFLTVNELENFGVLLAPEKFNDCFYAAHEGTIVDAFQRTAETLCKKFAKEFDKETEIEGWRRFKQDDGGSVSITQVMRDEALKDRNKFLPGKDIAAKIDNFSPIDFLKSKSIGDLPIELIQFIEKVEHFFNS